jgi:hypothetical protein
MKIPGSPPPLGGAHRVANAYGVTPKRAARVEGQESKVEGPATRDPRLTIGGLRSVLNDEERAYFDQIAVMGPVTYGPSRKGGVVPEAPKGLRLDVRG